MEISFNLHKFGADEMAVGQLINGDLPTDDEERWAILDAPRYHIQSLLDDHLRSQTQLHTCRDSGKPFVLFLRSFSTEQTSVRVDKNISSHFSLNSLIFQQWLTDILTEEGVPVIKLHGGSDGFISDLSRGGNVLSTNSANWEAVAL